MSPKQDRIWWSGGGANMLHTFDLADNKLQRTSKAEVDPSKLTKEERDKLKADLAKQKEFKSGVCLQSGRQAPLLARHQHRHASRP